MSGTPKEDIWRRTRLLMYIPYSFETQDYGSSVRPLRMSEAFSNIGTELTVVSGSRPERSKALRRLLAERAFFDCAYVEPSTWPLHPFDYLVLFWLRIKRTPIGLYYRDAYWRFPEWFAFHGWKQLELSVRYRIDLIVYRLTVDIMYFQSASLAGLFKFPAKSLLPPGARSRSMNGVRDYARGEKTVLYVGGLTVRYGKETLLKSMRIVTRKDPTVKFVIIGRRDETKALPPIGSQNVAVLNVAGRELERFLERAHVGLVLLEKRCPYNDLVLPVKLFDYLSYKLPVVATDCDEISKFVRKYRIGLVADRDPEKVAEAILRVVNSGPLARTLSRNCGLALEDRNRWEDRARKVVEGLLRLCP